MMTTTHDPRTSPRPPAPVRVAVAAVLTGVVLHLIGLVIGLTAARPSPRAVERAARQGLGSSSTPDLVHTVTTLGTVVPIVWTILICVAGSVLAVMMYRGRNWARVTLTVFAALELVGVVVLVARAAFGPTIPDAGASAVGVVVRGVVAVTTVVFLVSAWRKPAGQFFARRRPAPAG